MEENIVKFEEKLKELVALGKKKKSVLEIQEINDFFSDMELSPEQMEQVFEYLEAKGLMCSESIRIQMTMMIWKLYCQMKTK